MKSTYSLLIFTFILFGFGLQAQKVYNQKPSTSIKVLRLSNHINSDAADFAPTRYGNRIYFTSMNKNSGEQVSTKIYSFIDGGKKRPVDDLNMKRKSSHIANVAFMPDASRMYFSICRDGEQDRCEIWFRDKKFEGGWGTAQKLPEMINQRGSTSTMPTIGWDEEQKKFALFFVSDRKGGYGGKDIWVSHIRFDGVFEDPYPLTVNTPKDEVTPFFDRKTQTLYFSSNGHKGEGRFDIYYSEKKGDMWDRPENMGRPYNSGYDDLYFTTHEMSGTAYLTSDRPGSICNGTATDGWQCYDVYEVLGHDFEEEIITKKNYKAQNNMAMQYIEN